MGMIVVSRSKEWLRWCCAESVLLCTVEKELAWLFSGKMKAFGEAKVTLRTFLDGKRKEKEEGIQRTRILDGKKSISMRESPSCKN
ncbi:hypothetical protein GE21DRAFT_1285862, partial [Neurospora crassa]